MKDYRIKLESLHRETVKESMFSDYFVYQSIKKLFDTPNLTYYQFGLLKQMIVDFLKMKGLSKI
jgi:hypothetical protein